MPCPYSALLSEVRLCDAGHYPGLTIDVRPWYCACRADCHRSGGDPTHMPTKPSREVETFPNPEPGRDYEIQMTCPEFTCLCPRTGQPDFATFTLTYVPDRSCIELKSLKLYLWSFRNEGHFHEAVTNRIFYDLVNACQPR